MKEQEMEVKIKVTFKNKFKRSEAIENLRTLMLVWGTLAQKHGTKIESIHVEPNNPKEK